MGIGPGQKNASQTHEWPGFQNWTPAQQAYMQQMGGAHWGGIIPNNAMQQTSTPPPTTQPPPLQHPNTQYGTWIQGDNPGGPGYYNPNLPWGAMVVGNDPTGPLERGSILHDSIEGTAGTWDWTTGQVVGGDPNTWRSSWTPTYDSFGMRIPYSQQAGPAGRGTGPEGQNRGSGQVAPGTGIAGTSLRQYEGITPTYPSWWEAATGSAPPAGYDMAPWAYRDFIPGSQQPDEDDIARYAAANPGWTYQPQLPQTAPTASNLTGNLPSQALTNMSPNALANLPTGTGANIPSGGIGSGGGPDLGGGGGGYGLPTNNPWGSLNSQQLMQQASSFGFNPWDSWAMDPQQRLQQASSFGITPWDLWGRSSG